MSREFTYMFVLGTDIACSGADERNIRNRAERWKLSEQQRLVLDGFLESAPAGAHLEIRNEQDCQLGVLVCSYDPTKQDES